MVDAEKGFVVTNAHVVRDVKPEHIKLTFQDGREVTAEKVLVDPRTDVAVIKIPADHLVALQWAGPEEVKRGQWVIAVGSPMGFGGSVTAGIISAPSTRHRFFGGGQPGEFRANLGDPYAVEDYIQTDAAINPGNSGGPLLSLDGKVIGINTLIVSSTFSSAGLGFAVPQRLARPVVEALIETGRVVRGHLGVAIIEPSKIDDETAWELFRMRNADEVFNKYHLRKDDRGLRRRADHARRAGGEGGHRGRRPDPRRRRDADARRGQAARGRRRDRARHRGGSRPRPRGPRAEDQGRRRRAAHRREELG